MNHEFMYLPAMCESVCLTSFSIIKVFKCKSLFYLWDLVRLLAVYIKYKVFLSALAQYTMDKKEIHDQKGRKKGKLKGSE